jgi:transposase-like protein
MNMEKYNREKIRQEIEAFETADKFKQRRMIGNSLERLKNIIGHIEVQCPSCSMIQNSENFVSKTCIHCGKRFQIFPNNRPSRVPETAWNKKKRLLIHEYYHLNKTGRFLTIM